ncbi:unnamed protein product [Rhizoctonia solani]|uniref:Transmembrane protein n=1 Tax=Rhizoctonia solani TaxID=456999 RepID=A0A8H3CAS9_9AGAM|nr:unnamed protein product [Rhizoctonia solani]
MSLDINWIILIIVFTALVLEVLTAVAYVFENCWTFDTPRTRAFHGDKAIRDFVPDAYTAVWTSEVIGVEKKQSDAIKGRVDPLAPSFGQKHHPSPRTGPTNRKLTPDNGMLIRVAARISSWMTALASRTTATVKPVHDGNIKTQRPSRTKVEPTIRTFTTTDSSLTIQCHLQGVMPGLTCSPSVFAFQGIEVQTLANMSASTSLPIGIAPAGATRLLVAPKVPKVSTVEGLNVPGYQSLTPTVRVSTGAINRARSLAVIEGWRGNYTWAPSKPSKKPYHPTHLSEVGAKEVPQGLKDSAIIFGPARPAIAHPETEALPAREPHPAPVFTPGTEPVSIIPAKRRLRARVLETVRPAKRRRLACTENQNTPSSNSVHTESPAVAKTPLKRSHPNTPNPASPPTPSSTPYLIAPSTASALDTPTTPTGSLTSRRRRSTDTPVSHKPVSDSARAKLGLHKPHGSLAPVIVPAKPRSPSPPRSLVPARRSIPAKFGQPGVSQTKRRRIYPADIVELPTPLPLKDAASLQPPASLLTQPGNQPTRNDPPILASDLISHLIELTRGTAKPTRALTPTSDESNSPATIALGPMIDTIMSSSGKPGAPSRVFLRAPVMSRANVGEPIDVDMIVLDAMATPDVSMSSSAPDTSFSSTGSAPTSPMAVEYMEGPETTATLSDDCKLVDEWDVEMDPDSLMGDGTHNGSIQRQDWIPTMSDQSTTTQVRPIIEDIVPMEKTSAGVATEETFMDTAEPGEQEPTAEEPISAFVGPTEDPQQVSSLVETFSDMQVGSGASEEASGEPNPEAECAGEDVAVTETAVARQEPELEPVTGIAQALGAMQVSLEGEAEAHPEVPNRSATLPAEPVADLAQSLAGMQVGSLAVDSTSLDLPHSPVDPEEYVEDPFDELIQALVTTHLPAPVIVPYESEPNEIGVTDAVSGATGSDFISLGLEDEEEEESEGEEDEQALMDAAAAAAAWIGGL